MERIRASISTEPAVVSLHGNGLVPSARLVRIGVGEGWGEGVLFGGGGSGGGSGGALVVVVVLWCPGVFAQLLF